MAGPVLDFTDTTIAVGVPSCLFQYRQGISMQTEQKYKFSVSVNKVWYVTGFLVVDVLERYQTVVLSETDFMPILQSSIVTEGQTVELRESEGKLVQIYR